MFHFFDPVIAPLLTAVRARVVVEVGAGKGPNTERLLAWAEEQRGSAVVNVIDPAPDFAADELVKRHPETMRLHRGLSLDVLPTIAAPDMVLLDGDHNWYTVLNELRALEQAAAEGKHRFPVVVLHDVDWPYGRRDLYYDPGSIPEEFRRPFRQAGIVPGDPELHDDVGLNRSLANALAEGGEHNGVRTALEDFLAESSRRYRLLTVPGRHGAGVLVDRARASARSKLGATLDELESADFLREQCQRIEAARVQATIELSDANRARAKAERREQEAAERAAASTSRADEVDAASSEPALQEKLAGEMDRLRGEASAAVEAKHKARHELEVRVGELEAATAARDDALAQLGRSRDDAENLGARADAATERLETLGRELDAARTDAAGAAQEAAGHRVEAARARADADRSEQQAAAARAQLDGRMAELRTATVEHDRLVAELRRSGLDVTRADADTAAYRERARALADELDATETRVAGAMAARAEAVDALALRTEAFEGERRELEGSLVREATRIGALEAEIRRARAELRARVEVLERDRTQARARVETLVGQHGELSAQLTFVEQQRLDLIAQANAVEGERDAAIADGRTRVAALERELRESEVAQARLVERRRAEVDALHARRFELRDQAVAKISPELDRLRGDLERVANSHAWRFGHGLMRFLKLLSFRRARTPGGVERSLQRLSRIDLPPPYQQPALAPPRRDEGPAALPAANGQHAAGGTSNGAHHVGNGSVPESGAARLVRAGRADQTADGFITDDRWEDLFTRAERHAARARLAAAEKP